MPKIIQKVGKTIECWNCSKVGHIKKNCRVKKDAYKVNTANAVVEEV